MALLIKSDVGGPHVNHCGCVMAAKLFSLLRNLLTVVFGEFMIYVLWFSTLDLFFFSLRNIFALSTSAVWHKDCVKMTHSSPSFGCFHWACFTYSVSHHEEMWFVLTKYLIKLCFVFQWGSYSDNRSNGGLRFSPQMWSNATAQELNKSFRVTE